MTRRRKTLLIVVSSLAGLLLSGGLLLWAFLPTIVRGVITGTLRDNLACDVKLGGLRMHGLSGLTLTDLQLLDPADNNREVVYVERLEARLAGIPWPWADERRLTLVKIDHPRITAVRAADGTINFQRLRKVKPPEESKGGGGPKTILEHVEINGADLRLIDLASTAASAEPAAQSAYRMVQFLDLSIKLDQVSPTATDYRLAVDLADTAWGPLAVEGTANLDARSASLAMTRGSLSLTADNLATLPIVPAGLTASLSPTARIVLADFHTDGTRRGSQATVDITDLGLTLPRYQRLTGVKMTATLADDLLTVAVRDVPAVAQQGLGTIGNVQADLTLNLDSGKLVLDIPSASVMGGSVAGKVTVPDVRSAQPAPEGTLTLKGIQARSEEASSLVAIDGTLDFRKLVGQNGAATLQATLSALVAVSKIEPAEGPGGQETLATLISLPIVAGLSADLDRPERPLGFEVRLGADDKPLFVNAAGVFDRAQGVVIFRKSSGHLSLTEELLAAAAAIKPEAGYAEQFKVSGDVAFDISEGTRLPLATPQAVAGNISLTSGNLSFRIPGEEQSETIKLVASLTSSADPQARYVGTLRADLLASKGVINVAAMFDEAGQPLTQTFGVDGLRVSDSRLKVLARMGWVPVDSRAAIKALPEFTVSVSAKANDRRDRRTGERHVDGSLEVLWPDDAAAIKVRGEYASVGSLLKVTSTTTCRTIGSDLVAALRPALVEISKDADAKVAEILKTVPAFSTGFQVDVRATGNARTAEFIFDQAQIVLKDLAFTASTTLDGQPLEVPVKGGQGTITVSGASRTLTKTADGAAGPMVVKLGTGTADFEADVFGSRPKVQAQWREGAAEAGLQTPATSPLRLEALPEVLRKKAAQLKGGEFLVTAKVTAADLPSLGSSAADLTAGVVAQNVRLELAGRDGQPRLALAGLTAAARRPPAPANAAAKPVAQPWNVEVKDVRLADADGRSWLPAGSSIEVRPVVNLAVDWAAGPFEMSLPGGKGFRGTAEYNWNTGRLSVADLDASVDFDSLDLAAMSGPVAEYLRPLAPKGSVTLRGRLDANQKAASILDSATYSITLAARGLSAVHPDNKARSPARDVDATASRAGPEAVHELTLVTRHPQDGDLEARVSYAADRLAVEATLRKFVLSPQLAALAGPRVGDCTPAGLFDGSVKATLARDALGRWIPSEMGGTLSGLTLSASDPGQELKFTGGTFKARFEPARIVLETFQGSLADGQLVEKSELLAPVRDDPASAWRIVGGKLSATRLMLKQFKSIANRPPNELDGRLTIDLASKDDFGFAGPLTDLNQFTAKGHITFGEGHLWQLPLFKLLQNKLFEGVATVLRGKFDPTSFRKAEGDFAVAAGKLHLDGLTIDSDMVRLVIQGDVYLKGQLDLRIASSIRLGLEDRAGEIGQIIPGLGKDLEKIKSILDQLPGGELPIAFGFYKVSGTYDKPVIESDPEGSIKKFLGSALEFLSRKNEKPNP